MLMESYENATVTPRTSRFLCVGPFRNPSGSTRTVSHVRRCNSARDCSVPHQTFSNRPRWNRLLVRAHHAINAETWRFQDAGYSGFGHCPVDYIVDLGVSAEAA